MRSLITLFLTVLTLFLFAPAYAQISSGTVVGPLTGQVSTYNSVTGADGSQSYMWNDSQGRTTTGYFSSPQGGTSNFTTTSPNGQVGYGSIHQGQGQTQQPFFPTPPNQPSQGQAFGGTQWSR